MCSIDPYKLHIKDIKTISSFVSSDAMLEDEHEISFELLHDFGINEEDNLVRSLIDIGVHAINKGNGMKNEAKYQIAFVYLVENLNVFIKSGKGNKKQIDNQLITTLASISYSTARGIVYQQSRGYWMEHVVLPIVKPEDLMSKEFIRPASR